MRRSASGSPNEQKLRITSTTLNIGVRILQILPGMPKVCYSLLFDQSHCMGWKLAIVVFTFQLGRISVLRDDILISTSLVLDSGEPCLRLDMDKVHSMKWNISRMLKTLNHPRVRYHQYGDFHLLDAILRRRKGQPDGNLKDRFEEENEPQLHRLTCDIVIIKDKELIHPLG